MGNERPAPYPAATWRLLIDDPADGATNMAVDEAILAAVVDGLSPPTLRLYSWSPPCLSLGRNQPLSNVDLVACREMGIDVVRRPTGGRAILHTDELTYALVLLQSDPRATGDVVESYRRLSEGLLTGLRSLGVAANRAVGQRKGGTDLTAICFETPSDYEITAGGRKLMGSAQWRAKGGVLQHGTLPLHGALDRIVACLNLPEVERESQRLCLLQKAITLEEALGQPIPFCQAADAMATGLAKALRLTLVPGELTAHELAVASELRHNRYSEPDWTGRA